MQLLNHSLKRKIVIGFTVLSVLIGLTGCTLINKGEEANSTDENKEEDYITIVADQLQQVPITDTHVFYSPVKGISEGAVLSAVSGEVSNVFVKNGDTIKSETLLFEIEPKQINRQIEQAKKSVQLAKSNYETSNTRYEEAQDTLKKNKALLASGAITESQFDQFKAQATPAQRDAAKIQLEQAELQLKQLKDSLSDYKVLAKQAGKLNSFTLKSGDLIQAGMTLGRIIDMQSYQVEVAVAENLYTRLSLDTPVAIYLESIEQGFTAQITEIGQSPAVNGKLFPVKVAFTLSETNDVGDTYTKLNGLMAKVSFELGSNAPLLAVKSDILLKDAEGVFLYKLEGVNGNDFSAAKPIKQYLQTGFDNGEFIEIVQGITAEDWIVVEGQHYITQDREVRVLLREE